MSISVCNNTEDATCSPDSAELITNSTDLGITIGAFEPSVDNGNKEDPFSNEINLNTRITIEGMVRARATIALKKLQANTDFGRIIEKVKEEEAATIESVKTDYSSKLSLGPIDKATGSRTLMIQDDPQLLVVDVVASRVTETYARSYDTILDMFGNIGGSVDFMIILILVCFNWIETLIVAKKVRHSMYESLNLAPILVPAKSKSCKD